MAEQENEVGKLTDKHNGELHEHEASHQVALQDQGEIYTKSLQDLEIKLKAAIGELEELREKHDQEVEQLKQSHDTQQQEMSPVVCCKRFVDWWLCDVDVDWWSRNM